MVPLKVGFFAWEASWGKVMTLDQLKKRGRSLANRCYLCEEEEETLNHLLVHCSKARMLWELILAIVGFGWVFPFSVRQVLLAWQGTNVGKKRKKVGGLRLCASFGQCGAREIEWSSIMRPSLCID